MHCGSIHRDTAAARIFTYLDSRRGHWIDGFTLSVDTRTTAVSTRVAEVRTQIGELGMKIDTKRDKLNGKPAFFYRITLKDHKDES